MRDSPLEEVSQRSAERASFPAVIPEAAAGGYPGPIVNFLNRALWIPALAALGRDDKHGGFRDDS
jgi:hypothetical protein